ncbi:8-amino-7-oxononanoate synthase [Sesbania bispinosa]|nr:8-amino-7-oxononanoate synthase [Sesbania bispinosa]
MGKQYHKYTSQNGRRLHSNFEAFIAKSTTSHITAPRPSSDDIKLGEVITATTTHHLGITKKF